MLEKEHCANCPLSPDRRPCVAVTTGHRRYCQLVDPSHKDFNPGYLKHIVGDAVDRPPPPVRSDNPLPLPLPSTPPPRKRLVVSRHGEDLTWLKDVPKDIEVKVFNKGVYIQGIDSYKNEKREAGNILYHVVENYHRLADVTFFCQGNPFDHSPDFLERLALDYDRPTTLTTRYLEGFPASWITAQDKVEYHQGYEVRYGDATINQHGQGSYADPWFDSDAWDYVFACPMPRPLWFGYGNSWAVPRASIRARPFQFYKHLYEVCDSGEGGNSRTEPPVNPWSLEATMGYVWSDPKQYPHKVRWDVVPTKTFPKLVRDMTPEERRVWLEKNEALRRAALQSETKTGCRSCGGRAH